MSVNGIDRRLFVGLLTASACCGGLPAEAQKKREIPSDGRNLRRGCEPSAHHLRTMTSRSRIFASSLELHRAADGAEFKLLRSSADKDLDLGLDKALSRIATTFKVNPAFGFDDVEIDNAWASSEVMVPGTDGTVAFGTRYFKKWLDYDPSGITVLATCAHEYAHVMLFRSGLYRQVNAGQPNVKRSELHADYMAAYYLGLRKRENPNASFWKAGEKFRLIGDTVFSSKNHHGTPEERLAAAEAGFLVGFKQGVGAQVAFAFALDYVKDK
jgi:hypothetical protein